MSHQRFTEWNGLTKGMACVVDGGERGADYIFQEYVIPPSGLEKAYVAVVEQLDPRATKGGKPNPGRRRDRVFKPHLVSPLPSRRASVA